MPDAKTHILDFRTIFFLSNILLLWPKSGLRGGGIHTLHDDTVLRITVFGKPAIERVVSGTTCHVSGIG